MSKAPYQIRTTYLDGTQTRDMVENFNDDPQKTIELYIMNDPAIQHDVQKIDVLNLDNRVLYTFNFSDESRRVA